MHETEDRMSQTHVRSSSTTTTTTTTTSNNHHQQHHQGSNNSSGNSSSSSSRHSSKNGHSTSRMACEKAARKLRATMLKAARLGVTTGEVAGLPAAKRIVSQRDHDWKLAVLLLLMFGGGVIVALVCTTSRGCAKIEDINLAT